MTLLFVDSFDHWDTADALTKWTAYDPSSTNLSISVGGGRRGTNGFTSAAAGRGLVKGITSSSTVICGFACAIGGSPTSAQGLIDFREASTLHIQLRANNDLSVSVLRNATVLATSAAAVLTAGYCFVELKATIHDTTGAYEVRINGANVLSATGVDTRNGGTGVITAVSMLIARVGQVCDDFYICNSSGSTNNDFLGDVRVDAGLPSGNGNSSQLTGSDGNSVNNYLLVDESAPNGDTDYVQSSTVTQKDTYTFPNLAHTPANIFGVQVCISAKKDDAGTRSVCSVTRSGGADTDGTSHALSTSYQYYLEIAEQDPATAAAWTQSGYNAAEFGVKVVA